jgi:hypothetical protein
MAESVPALREKWFSFDISSLNTFGLQPTALSLVVLSRVAVAQAQTTTRPKKNKSAQTGKQQQKQPTTYTCKSREGPLAERYGFRPGRALAPTRINRLQAQKGGIWRALWRNGSPLFDLYGPKLSAGAISSFLG